MELVNGIVGYGCRVFYGVKAIRFVLGNNSALKYGARLIHSILGDNSTVSCCELLNNLIFPAHEQHHNTSFLIASLVRGQSNLAAGCTIGSNHNSRANDGEIDAGRGFWPGLSTSLKHSSRFASYVLLSKGDYPYELDIAPALLPGERRRRPGPPGAHPGVLVDVQSLRSHAQRIEIRRPGPPQHQDPGRGVLALRSRTPRRRFSARARCWRNGRARLSVLAEGAITAASRTRTRSASGGVPISRTRRTEAAPVVDSRLRHGKLHAARRGAQGPPRLEGLPPHAPLVRHPRDPDLLRGPARHEPGGRGGGPRRSARDGTGKTWAARSRPARKAEHLVERIRAGNSPTWAEVHGAYEDWPRSTPWTRPGTPGPAFATWRAGTRSGSMELVTGTGPPGGRRPFRGGTGLPEPCQGLPKSLPPGDLPQRGGDARRLRFRGIESLRTGNEGGNGSPSRANRQAALANPEMKQASGSLPDAPSHRPEAGLTCPRPVYAGFFVLKSCMKPTVVSTSCRG